MSNPRNTDDAVQTAMDRAWEQVNALGGSHNENDPFDRGYDCAIGQVLQILHRLGGRDRLDVERRRLTSEPADRTIPFARGSALKMGTPPTLMAGDGPDEAA